MAKRKRDPITAGAYIEVTSGVSAFTGEPFCTVWIYANEDGAPLSSGQQTPEETRQMALQWLAAAEAAEGDAAVFAALKATGLPETAAAGFITDLRARRSPPPKPQHPKADG